MVVLNRAAWLSSITIALLAACCCALAVLQYRWISEFTDTERSRLIADRPPPERIEAAGPERARAASYDNFRSARSEAGHVISAREPIGVNERIEDSLQFPGDPAESGSIMIEKNIEPSLPALLAGAIARKRGEGGWLGISAWQELSRELAHSAG